MIHKQRRIQGGVGMPEMWEIPHQPFSTKLWMNKIFCNFETIHKNNPELP